MSLTEKIQSAYGIIDEVVGKYGDAPAFVGFSGGGDSLLCAHIITDYLPGTKIFHANTGIGLEATRKYVRQYCKDQEWDLVEIRAKEDCGQDYEKMVLEYGFPGPPCHYKMYQRLKERPIRKLHRRYKNGYGGKIIMFTGIRADESTVRAGYKNSIIDEVGGVVWVNPVYYFSGQDKYDYLTSNNIKQNPVSKLIGMSGECLCGAFAHKGELELIRMVEPETAEYIEGLQEKVYEKGFTWGWEGRPSKYRLLEKEGQQNMFFCYGCEKKGTEL